MARFYTYKGKKLPSVTTITGQLDKPALMHWAVNCACDYMIQSIDSFDEPMVRTGSIYSVIEKARKNYRQVSKKAMDIGSQGHAAIEHYLKTGKEPQNPPKEVEAAFLAFLEWLDNWDEWETLKAEHTLYADRYAGTCDWVCRLNEYIYIIDFKAAKGIYPEYQYQIAAYRACDPTIEGCGILRLDKETGYPEWKDTSITYEQDLKVFNALVELWYARNPGMEGGE